MAISRCCWQPCPSCKHSQERHFHTASLLATYESRHSQGTEYAAIRFSHPASHPHNTSPGGWRKPSRRAGTPRSFAPCNHLEIRPQHRRNPRTDQQNPVNDIRLIYTGVLSIRLHLCGHARGQNVDKRPFRHKKGTPSFLREFPESQ